MTREQAYTRIHFLATELFKFTGQDALKANMHVYASICHQTLEELQDALEALEASESMYHNEE